MTEESNGRWDRVRRIWEIIDQLRSESGCPWDRKQTPETVQTYLVEEAHEAASAVRSGHAAEAGEELGDLLFMVLFMVHLYEEKGDFRLEEVCDWIIEKMIRRHPHVFGDQTVRSAEEVRGNWEKIKAVEKANSGKTSSEIPQSLPALMRAHRILSRLSQRDTRWDDSGAQLREYQEKSRRLSEKVSNGAPVPAELLGELLLSLANLARQNKLRPEDCLHDAIKHLKL